MFKTQDLSPQAAERAGPGHETKSAKALAIRGSVLIPPNYIG